MRNNTRKKRRFLVLWFAGTVLLLFVCCIAVAAFVSSHASQVKIPAKSEPSLGEASVSSGNPVLLSVPLLAQGTEYPTGCESVSAAMLLRYWEIPVSVDSLIAALPQEWLYQDADGTWYGPHPNDVFIGSPYSEDGSFGCYAPVIAAALSKFLPQGYTVKAENGAPLSSLTQDYIDLGIPVLIWASVGMQETCSGMSWYLEDGSLFTWTQGEHCLVLVGYDESAYYLNDPTGEGGTVCYPKDLVEERYQSLFSQAVVILPPNAE